MANLEMLSKNSFGFVPFSQKVQIFLSLFSFSTVKYPLAPTSKAVTVVLYEVMFFTKCAYLFDLYVLLALIFPSSH